MLRTELHVTDLGRLRGRLGLSQEMLARALEVSGRSVERWESGSSLSDPRVLRVLDRLKEIARLGEEVYGDALPTFMRTPRRSLDGRTPIQALARGDIEPLFITLVRASEGSWA